MRNKKNWDHFLFIFSICSRFYRKNNMASYVAAVSDSGPCGLYIYLNRFISTTV